MPYHYPDIFYNPPPELRGKQLMGLSKTELDLELKTGSVELIGNYRDFSVEKVAGFKIEVGTGCFVTSIP